MIGAVAATAVVAGGSSIAVEEVRMRMLADNGRAVRRGAERADPTAVELLWRVDTSRQVAALTFDDGPDPRYTPAILAALDEAGAVATFFMQGSHADEHHQLVRDVAERHAIGNHSFTHPNMGTASAATARRELGRTHDLIERLVGEGPTLFRPPYGSLSGATGMVAADMGYDIILWSDRISSRRTPEANVRRLSRSIRPGAIVLGHDGGILPNQVVVDSLPLLLSSLAEQGVELVTVPELLAGMRADRAEPVAETADSAQPTP